MLKPKHTPAAPMGMAFLFLSLAAIPVSLRAVGINIDLRPRASAVLETWRQVADAFAGSNQAVSEPVWTKADDCESAADNSALVACLEEVEESVPVTDAAPQVESDSPVKADKPCAKVTARPAKAAKRVEVAVIAAPVPLPMAAFRPLEIAASALQASQIGEEIRIQFAKEMARSRVDLRHAVREMRASKKSKFDVMVVVPGYSDCGFRKITPAPPDKSLLKKSSWVRTPKPDEFTSQDTGF